MGFSLLSIAQDWVLLNWQEIMRCFLLEVRTNGVTRPTGFYMVLTSREFALSVLNVIALIPSKLLNVSGFQIIMNSRFLKSFFAIIPTCLKCQIIWVNFPVVGPHSCKFFSENAKKNLSYCVWVIHKMSHILGMQ